MGEEFNVGDLVDRKGSDYHFPGMVVAKFEKINGAIRYVVEDDRGTLFIMSDKSMVHRENN